jgi:hypothetical protein
MYLIVLAIIIVGFFAIYSIAGIMREHNKTIEGLKKQELEANPEYRKKVALEDNIRFQEDSFKHCVKRIQEIEDSLAKAKVKKDKTEINILEASLESNKIGREEAIQSIRKYRRQLAGINKE